MTYPYGYGPPPGWGMPPQYPQPQQSGLVYVPMPNPVKADDDPATAVMKQLEMSERLKKFFKEEKKEEKKDSGDKTKGLTIKQMMLLMTVSAVPLGILTSTLFVLWFDMMKHFLTK